MMTSEVVDNKLMRDYGYPYGATRVQLVHTNARIIIFIILIISFYDNYLIKIGNTNDTI